jgi:hypothetical protein
MRVHAFEGALNNCIANITSSKQVLPTNPDGSFDEEGDGVEVVDEIEDIEPGGQATLSVDLAAGHYVLLCNKFIVLDNGEVISHFAMGMSTDFTVTAARH